jgi:hypothetical protein
MEPENQQPAQTPAEPATPAAPASQLTTQHPQHLPNRQYPLTVKINRPTGRVTVSNRRSKPVKNVVIRTASSVKARWHNSTSNRRSNLKCPTSHGGAQQSPQMPQYQPGQEVSPEQLQQDVVQTASAIAGLQVQQQLQQHDAKRNLDADITSLPKSFDELNPDNDLYTPELDQAIAQEFQERAFRVVGYQPNGQPIRQLADPSVRLNDIAQRHVASARALAQRMSASGQAATAALADTAAPRPAGQGPAEKPFTSLSREEMRKKLGYAKQG